MFLALGLMGLKAAHMQSASIPIKLNIVLFPLTMYFKDTREIACLWQARQTLRISDMHLFFAVHAGGILFLVRLINAVLS